MRYKIKLVGMLGSACEVYIAKTTFFISIYIKKDISLKKFRIEKFMDGIELDSTATRL